MRHPRLPRRPARHGHHLRRGLLNALEIVGKKHRRGQDRAQRRRRRLDCHRRPLCGPGRQAARTSSCATRKGVIYKGRTAGMNEYKERSPSDTTARTLAEALMGADVFIGLSVANVRDARRWCTPWPTRPDHLRHGQPRPGDHLRRGAGRPPGHASSPPAAATIRTRSTMCWASPSSSAGALDVRARAINKEMKLAATQALAPWPRKTCPTA